MTGKIFRACILLSICGISLWIGQWMYTISMDFIAFQLSFYEWFLNSQQVIDSGQEQLVSVRKSALEFLGEEQHATQLPTEDLRGDKLATFAQKLQNIAIAIGLMSGIIMWKIMFDIVFSLKKSIHDVKEFIT